MKFPIYLKIDSKVFLFTIATGVIVALVLIEFYNLNSDIPNIYYFLLSLYIVTIAYIIMRKKYNEKSLAEDFLSVLFSLAIIFMFIFLMEYLCLNKEMDGNRIFFLLVLILFASFYLIDIYNPKNIMYKIYIGKSKTKEKKRFDTASVILNIFVGTIVFISEIPNLQHQTMLDKTFYIILGIYIILWCIYFYSYFLMSEDKLKLKQQLTSVLLATILLIIIMTVLQPYIFDKIHINTQQEHTCILLHNQKYG